MGKVRLIFPNWFDRETIDLLRTLMRLEDQDCQVLTKQSVKLLAWVRQVQREGGEFMMREAAGGPAYRVEVRYTERRR